jgi:hypothetical protein
MKNAGGGNVKIMKRDIKQTLVLHRKSTRTTRIIQSVGLWSDYSQSFPHIRLRCHYDIFSRAFTSA